MLKIRRKIPPLSVDFLSFMNGEENEDISYEIFEDLKTIENDSIPSSTQKQMDNTMFKTFQKVLN